MKRLINSFDKLKAWQEAHKLVVMIYKVTTSFPKHEMYRLTDQLCRSASSIAAILVEGNSRGSRKEYIHFVFQARASLEELKYHLLLAKDLGYLDESLYNKLMAQVDLVGKLINGLLRYLKSSRNVQYPKSNI